MRQYFDIFSIMMFKFKNSKNSVYIHEFIIKLYFDDYESLKNDCYFNENKKYKEITFDESIIINEYYLTFDTFMFIIKYLYGYECDIIKYNLNELFKIHAFVDKHGIKGNIKNKIESRIDEILQNIPIINFNGSMNS